MSDVEQLRDTLRQWLETDQLLGVRFAPIEANLAIRAPMPSRASSAPEMARRPELAPPPASKGVAVSTRQPDPPRPASTTRPPPRSAAPRAVPLVRVETNYADPVAAERARHFRLLDDEQVKTCRKCVLCEGRTQTVFGQGSPIARVVFVGEGPGFEEDKQGLAFVGPAGQMLTRMIIAMGLTRDDVYICNTVKCRPPNNRTPLADEILACLPYLQEQLRTIHPEVIVALGAPAAKTLLNTAEAISKLRGRWYEYYPSGSTGVGPAIPMMPTFHPAYLLRNEAEKGKAWADIQLVMKRLGLPLPQRAGRDANKDIQES